PSIQSRASRSWVSQTMPESTARQMPAPLTMRKLPPSASDSRHCIAFAIAAGYARHVTLSRPAGNSLLLACILGAMSAVRVLVVDDDRTVREMLAQYLTEHGYEVALADGGEAMRTELERALPSAVLLDVRM